MGSELVQGLKFNSCYLKNEDRSLADLQVKCMILDELPRKGVDVVSMSYRALSISQASFFSPPSCQSKRKIKQLHIAALINPSNGKQIV